MTDETLARWWQEGSDAAFAELVGRFYGRIFNFLWHATGHREDAEDLTQETFLAAHRSIPRYQPARTFGPWLFGIARHTLADHWRRQRPCDELPPDFADPISTSENAPAAREERGSALWQQARRLKPRQFEALWLRYGEGFDIAGVARALGITRIHAKVLLFRARKELARRAGSGKGRTKGDRL